MENDFPSETETEESNEAKKRKDNKAQTNIGISPQQDKIKNDTLATQYIRL